MTCVQQLLKRLKHLRLAMIVVFACLTLCACAPQEIPHNSEEWQNNIANCWPCQLYDASFSALDRAIVSITKDMTRHALIILGFGLLFWLLFKVGTFIVSVKEPNSKQFVQNILITFFKAILVSSLLFNPEAYVSFIAQNIVQPVLLVFVDLSRIILTADQDVASYLTTPEDFISTLNMTTQTATVFGKAKAYIGEIIYRITVALKTGQALGITILMDHGFINFLMGLLVVFIFFLLLIRFPIIFIDSFIRLGAVIILSPFMFVAWVFPPTKGVIKKGWDILFGAMVNILFGCIFMAMFIYVLYVYTERAYPSFFTTAGQTSNPYLVFYIKTFNNSIVAIFVLILTMNKLSAHVPALAKKFGGDGSTGALAAQTKGLFSLAKTIAKSGVKLAVASPSALKKAGNAAKKIKDKISGKGNQK